MKETRAWIGRFEARSVMLLAAWTLGAAGATYADQHQPAPDPATTDRDVGAAFREADKNGDGQLNRQEALILPSVAAHFDQIDTDQDQHISLAELAKAVQP